MTWLLAISLAALGGLGWLSMGWPLMGWLSTDWISGAQTQSQDAFQISVNVDLVVLQATVHDKKGGFAPNLKEPDFQVYEDGAKQSIRLFRHEDIPVTVGLVIDHSGSMHPKLAHVVEAARTFVRASNPRDQMFVVNFNDSVTLGLPGSEPFTDRPEDLEAAISKTPAVGQTKLYDAVVQALDRLRTGSYEKKVLVVISDGDNASVLKLPEVLKKAEESSAAIYTIGIFEDEDPDRNPDVLRRLARATGGEAFFPRKLEDVVANCENIARDIRHQYTLGLKGRASCWCARGRGTSDERAAAVPVCGGGAPRILRVRLGGALVFSTGSRRASNGWFTRGLRRRRYRGWVGMGSSEGSRCCGWRFPWL